MSTKNSPQQVYGAKNSQQNDAYRHKSDNLRHKEYGKDRQTANCSDGRPDHSPSWFAQKKRYDPGQNSDSYDSFKHIHFPLFSLEQL